MLVGGFFFSLFCEFSDTLSNLTNPGERFNRPLLTMAKAQRQNPVKKETPEPTEQELVVQDPLLDKGEPGIDEIVPEPTEGEEPKEDTLLDETEGSDEEGEEPKEDPSLDETEEGEQTPPEEEELEELEDVQDSEYEEEDAKPTSFLDTYRPGTRY